MRKPVDSDVDLHLPAQRAETRPTAWPVLAAVSAGGVLGALTRYAISVAIPHPPGAFAWSTFLINVSGCLLIGVLMVLITELWTGRRLVRPFWGVGVLGGYTTFSTYVVDVHQAMAHGRPLTALAYLAATPICALLGVWAGTTLATQAIGLARRVAESRAR